MGTTVQIFTDGACSGNPGRGGFGLIIKTMTGPAVLTYEDSAGYELTTNNRMELLAVITGLEKLKPGTSVEVVTDSKYVSSAINEGWLDSWIKNGWKTSGRTAVKNKDLWERYLEAAKDKKITFTWVKGHNGHPENERCDELAVKAANRDDLLEDIQYSQI